MAQSAVSLRRPFLILVAGLLALQVSIMVRGSREAAHFCEPITQPICIGSNAVHRFTRTPITIPTGPNPGGGDDGSNTYQTQAEAVAEIHRYRPLIDGARGCREYLGPFLCSVYLPPCTVSVEPIPPCRDLCERARSGCLRSMRHLGLSWTGTLNCKQFPTPIETPSCLSALRFGEVSVTVSDPAPVVSVPCFYDLSPSVHLQWLMPDGIPVSEGLTQPVHFERTDKRTATLTIRGFIDSQHGGNYTCITGDGEFRRSVTLDNIFEPVTGPSCEIITVPYCVDQLTYTRTSLPNHVFHSSQSDVEHFIQNVLEPGTCSSHMTTLLCSFLLPKCDDSKVFHDVLPCREVCEKVFADCQHVFFLEEIEGLPPPCETFVYSGQGQECYNGVEIGPVQVSETARGRRVEVECAYPAVRPAEWRGPGASPTALSERIEVEMVDSYTSRLIIDGFQDADSGIYTCSDGTFSQTVSITKMIVSQAITATCEQIKDENCRRHLGYDMTWRRDLYPISSRADGVPALSSFLDSNLDRRCSPYLQTLVCAHKFPKCIEGAVDDPELPCRELCKKVAVDCSDALAGLDNAHLSCGGLPSQSDGNCFNGVFISPVEYQTIEFIRLTTVEVNCTFLPPVNKSPSWRSPEGTLLSPGRFASPFNVDTEFVDSKTTKLIIDRFEAATDQGEYVCIVDGLEKSVSISDDVLTKGSCQQITEGVCSEGVGYTHAYFPNLLGHTTMVEALDVFKLFSSVDPDVLLCSPYTRPFLCTLYFPPCDPDAEIPTSSYSVPCKELCEKNALGCQNQSQYGVRDCVDTDILSLPCYDVDEVSIGSKESSGGPSSYFVDCTYILLPEYQPVWLLPNGKPVKSTDSASRLRAVQQSTTVTRLHIDDFTAQLDGGTYTCLGRNSNKTILLGDEDGAAMEQEVSIGSVMEEGTAFFSRIKVDCVNNLSPGLQPTWQTPDGNAIPYDSSQNVHAISVSNTVTRLVIRYHIPPLTTGTYTCVGSRDSATVDL